MGDVIRAIVARERDGRTSGQLEELTAADLPASGVLVDVAYSTINYKDALAVTGKAKLPHPAARVRDRSGRHVRESPDKRFRAGDRVLVNGYGLSEKYPGGYTQRQRIDPTFLVRVPETFSPEEAMALGTAGDTAMLCVQALEDHGVRPGTGPIVVTGASGGVGSVAVMLLAQLGYEVAATTGRVSASGDYLRDLARTTSSIGPSSRGRQAAGNRALGGRRRRSARETLATVIAQARYGATMTACGLAGGMTLPTAVALICGVTLAGIDSVMASHERRVRAWDRLAQLIDRQRLRTIYRVEPLRRVPELAAELLAGGIRGRVVIDVNA